jgi:hypothetical protein
MLAREQAFEVPAKCIEVSFHIEQLPGKCSLRLREITFFELQHDAHQRLSKNHTRSDRLAPFVLSRNASLVRQAIIGRYYNRAGWSIVSTGAFASTCSDKSPLSRQPPRLSPSYCFTSLPRLIGGIRFERCLLGVMLTLSAVKQNRDQVPDVLPVK